MKSTLLLSCVLSAGLFLGCSDKPQELIDTAQFEEQQHNLPHAKQLYADVIRLYPSSKQAEIARARLAQLKASP